MFHGDDRAIRGWQEPRLGIVVVREVETTKTFHEGAKLPDCA